VCAYSDAQLVEIDNLKDEFVPVLNETNDTTFLLVRSKTNTMAVNIATYLAGRYDLIPLPPACGRLENLLALKVEKNSAGAVRVQGPGLLIYDAGYGPGQTMDSHPDEEDIKVRDDNRTREAAALRHLDAHREQKRRAGALWQDRNQANAAG